MHCGRKEHKHVCNSGSGPGSHGVAYAGDGGAPNLSLAGRSLGSEISWLTHAFHHRPYHYVMVTDGFKWKFGVLDVANKKVHFSKALCVGMGISLAELMALITIWVSKVRQIHHGKLPLRF